MSDNTIEFPGSTKNDLPVESILEGIKREKLRLCLIIGVSEEDDKIHIYSSTAESATMIGLAQLAIHEILNG